MILTTYSNLAAALKTMKGFPGWTDEVSDSYWLGLNDLTDAVGEKMTCEVLRKFDERPSVKALRDWANTLAAPQPFDIRQITAPKPNPLRLTGPEPAQIGTALPPAAVREVFNRLRTEKPKDDDSGPIFGLQFFYPKTGKLDRSQPSYRKIQAQNLAVERNEHWPHQITSVFRKGDPLPTQAVVKAMEAQEEVAA